MISICIPTLKTRDQISPQICCLEGFSEGCEVYASCIVQSAAANRNDCLDHTAGEIVIQIDDDISGFYDGWVNDMIAPLSDPDIIITSARLLRIDGTFAPMMDFAGVADIGWAEVPRVPTAAIAFRRNNLRFFDDVEARRRGYERGYQLSGFEDDDFVHCFQELFPGKKVVINNDCKLVHLNEMKGQGKAWVENKKLFDSIWETSPDNRIRTRRGKK